MQPTWLNVVCFISRPHSLVPASIFLAMKYFSLLELWLRPEWRCVAVEQMAIWRRDTGSQCPPLPMFVVDGPTSWCYTFSESYPSVRCSLLVVAATSFNQSFMASDTEFTEINKDKPRCCLIMGNFWLIINSKDSFIYNTNQTGQNMPWSFYLLGWMAVVL